MTSTIEFFTGSEHFQLHVIADGVFAAISTPGKGAFANSAIIDLGDATLVVDTFSTIQAAQDLRKAAEHLTGRPVTYVFNTHWHGDHTFGNQVFGPGAELISTTTTREIMATFLQERTAKHAAHPELIVSAIEEMEADIREEKNEKRRQEMEWEVASDREYLKMLPKWNQTLPTVTFDEQLTLHGSRRTVHLITYGGGHTQSDGFVYLPEEKIAVMADLVLSGYHPILRYADPEQWLEILGRVEALNIETIIPGHGEVCAPATIRQVRGYITDMLALAQDIVHNKRDLNQIQIPEAYQDWFFSLGFAGNLQVLTERLVK